MKPLLHYALRYATRFGWRVFPLNGKEPLTANGFLNASTDEDSIRDWWTRWPDANIGVACDSEHGPIVIDIDKPNKKHGEVSGYKFLRTLDYEAEGIITRTAISREGRLHLYFAPMRDGTIVKRMIRPFSINGQKVAIDILGDGGYVVVPPSVHPVTGTRYRWGEYLDMEPFPKRLFRFVKKRSIKQIAPPLPEIIHEGERDSILTSMAGTMRRRGISPRAILEALRIENATRVRPPLDDVQLSKIARSIGAKDPASDDENLTDLGNARRFVAMHHEKVISIPSKGSNPWYVWLGTHWEADAAGEAMRLAKETVRSIHAEANAQPDEERRNAILQHAYRSEGAERIRAVVSLAATESELIVRREQLDRDMWLLNVRNGTIDLQTGKLYKHRRSDYITKISPVEYNKRATAPRWESFLSEIFDGDDALVGFIRRAVGYSLTGDTREHAFFFCYGSGRNGKSTFFDVIREMLSGYAVQADFSTFQATRNEGPRHDLARMRGARIVTGIEARGDRAFDETVLKQMTGGDTVTARHLYETSFEFKPQFKLWLAANHLPLVREQTEAFWSRVMMIPFTVYIPPHRRKKNLVAILTKELSGVLNWALKGCDEWRRNGLMAPDTVRTAISEYKEEFDTAGEFFAAKCELGDTLWTSRAALYQAFTEWWMETRGRNPISHTAFNRMINERTDIRPKKNSGMRGWQGVAVQDVRRPRRR